MTTVEMCEQCLDPVEPAETLWCGDRAWCWECAEEHPREIEELAIERTIR